MSYATPTKKKVTRKPESNVAELATLDPNIIQQKLGQEFLEVCSLRELHGKCPKTKSKDEFSGINPGYHGHHVSFVVIFLGMVIMVIMHPISGSRLGVHPCSQTS